MPKRFEIDYVNIMEITYFHSRMVLWNDLTREHMELFAGMKGIPRDSMKNIQPTGTSSTQLCEHYSYKVT